MPSARKPRAAKREYRINLVGKRRSDGSLFITSPNMAFFSAVLPDGSWDDVLSHLREFIEINFGRVSDLRLIHDASELTQGDVEAADIPPAYVVAEVASDRVHPA